MNKDTATQAIVANLAEPTASRDAKRELFEAAAYDQYLARNNRGQTGGLMTLEEFCHKSDDGKYYFNHLEACWWGFQAGFMAAALAGAQPQTAADVQTR